MSKSKPQSIRASVSRRGFFGSLAGSAAVSLLAPGVEAAASGHIRLGIATYSLRKFSRPDAIRMIQQLGIQYVNVKEFHLRYRSTPDELAAGREEFRKAGLAIVAGGAITLQKNDEADIRKYFEYAKACGMPVMVIAPSHDALPTIEKMVKEYNIRVAIHNHGVDDKHFPTPQVSLQAVKGRDPRMGLCIDFGYTVQSGVDPVAAVREAGKRLIAIHLWDTKSADPKGEICPVGDGIVPVASIFRQLMKINYPGTVDLEYEIDPDSPLEGMRKSLAYMRGVIAGLNA